MALEQLEMTTGLNKIDFAIKLLREWQPDEGYYLAFSGGKDSVVLYDIAVKSDVKFDAHYSVSPIDPPEVQKFIREHYPDVEWEYHAKGFWNIVDKKSLPMRQQRWCCELIKESGGSGRIVLTGVRSAESTKRSKKNFVESYIRNNIKKVLVSPLLQFTDSDIWQYIRENSLHYCSLYDEGFTRIGCILCPMNGKKDVIKMELERYPKIVNLWKRACDRLVQANKDNNYLSKRGKPLKHHFNTGEEMFQWWISRK
jgi:phosphoadenosine phosphosulfate reductase